MKAPSLSRFFDKRGKLLPPGQFSFLLDFLDDEEVSAALCDFLLVRNSICAFYCPVAHICSLVWDWLNPFGAAWNSENCRCVYVELMRERLELKDAERKEGGDIIENPVR